MSKKNKLEEMFSLTSDEPEVETVQEEVIIPETVINEARKTVFILTKFPDTITEIGYVFLANNEQNTVTVSNGRINLLQGRMYYIPIDKENINSDKFNIKIHSDVADRVDVRFVKDGFACVVPIRHNVVLKIGEKLCELIPF